MIMIRKLGLTLACAASLFSAPSFSATEHVFSANAHFDFTLPANEPQVFTNTFFFALESKCSIIDITENIPFSFKVLRKSGSFNGTKLATGDQMDVVVHPNDVFTIMAASGGRVELINHSDKAVTARCMSKG